ncbi:hypothetical protein ACFQGT_02540 [Natrialbaceae archaeon GCM10025810]|uniref:hypothetical protein n=1 Tax=Halovalidus salilacus TaxID=3075124 RepID=UPI00361FE29D
MRGPGLLWMLQTAAGLPMAGPMFFMGVHYLQSGRTVGGVAFLALGAVALYLPTYLLNRIGGPRSWLRGVIGRGGGGKDAADEGGGDESRSDARGSTVLERLRR